MLRRKPTDAFGRPLATATPRRRDLPSATRHVHLVLLFVVCSAVCWGVGHLIGVRNGTNASAAIGYGGGAVLAAVITLFLWHRGWLVPRLGINWAWVVFGPLSLVVPPTFRWIVRRRRDAGLRATSGSDEPQRVSDPPEESGIGV
jgi:hypothetical protein